MKKSRVLFRMVPIVFLILSCAIALSAAPVRAQSEPKWILAHKINRFDSAFLRATTWIPTNYYPGCFGAFGDFEESLDAYFDPSGDYTDANGFEFDVWQVDTDVHIDDLGADQEDIYGNPLISGQWYVSHEPCDCGHIPIASYIDYLKNKLDAYGTSRVALIYVDMKVIEAYSGYDDIAALRDTIRSGLGSYYRKINVLYSTAEWDGRGAFLQNDFIGTLWENELIGIDEDNDDAAGDDTDAALVAIEWAYQEGADSLYMSDDTEKTRVAFIFYMNTFHYPHIVGGWTISSDDDTKEDDNANAKKYWDEGVNLFLVQNYFEGDDGTGAYTYLKNKITADPSFHLADGCDRPWAEAPTADAGPNIAVTEGTTVVFNGSGSNDPDGSPLEYRWDFTSDGTWDTGWSSQPTAQHNWDDDFVGQVTLEVRDTCSSDTDTAAVTVSNGAPTISVIAVDPSSINESQSVNVFGSFGDPALGVASEPFSGSALWSDGVSTPVSVGTGSYTTSRSFPDDHPLTGTAIDHFTVSITIEDDDSGSDTATSPVVAVSNVAPTAVIDSVVQPNPHYILPIVHKLTFNGSFTDPGLPDTHTYDWNFGNVSNDSGPVTEENSGLDATTYTYPDPGTYTVTLTVTDDDTGQGTKTKEVTVVTAEEAVSILDNYIQGLEDDYFQKKAIQQKKAFSNKLDAVVKSIKSGAYKDAINKLKNDIKAKADGSKNSWIIDETNQEQEKICMMINDLIAYLKTL